MTPAIARQRVIPLGGWITAGVVFLLGFLMMNVAFIRENRAPVLVRFLAPIVVPLAAAGYTLLIAYVYGDARRRGMRYVMWTLLATFLFWGIGIILYFIVREPLLGYCSKCGSPASHGFAYCPRCGAGLQPACPACHRVIQGPWAHCAWCGTKV